MFIRRAFLMAYYWWRWWKISQRSIAESYVENIYVASILMLLAMCVISFYALDIVITSVYGTFATLVVLSYKSSYFVLFIASCVLSYVQGKTRSLQERRRFFARLMMIAMLVFVILAMFTYIIWTRFGAQLVEIAFFWFLSMTEIFTLVIHNMAFSVPTSTSTSWSTVISNEMREQKREESPLEIDSEDYICSSCLYDR